MDQKRKSKLDRLRDWWEMLQIKRRRHQSIWYLGYLGLTIMIYGFMIGYGVLSDTGEKVISTATGAEIRIDGAAYQLLNSQVNMKQRTAMITIANPEGTIIDNNKQLSTSVEFLNSSSDTFNAKVVQGDKLYYVIYLVDLPEKWNALRLNIWSADESEPKSGVVLLTADQSKTKELTVPSEDSVVADSLEFQIEWKQLQIKDNEKLIKDNQATIQENIHTMKQMESEKEYQTELEIKETNAKITQVEETNRQLEVACDSLNKEIQEYRSQIEKVEERLRDLVM